MLDEYTGLADVDEFGIPPIWGVKHGGLANDVSPYWQTSYERAFEMHLDMPGSVLVAKFRVGGQEHQMRYDPDGDDRRV